MTHLSLCSGIGGLDLAAEWAGFETVAQCEIDAYASKVLAKNFPGVPNLHDIRTVTNERLAELGIRTPAVISAGFPCQPYSLAGKGLGDRDDRDLWGEVARVLREIRPRWFVGENTPGLFARSNQRYFRRVLDDLAELGYSVGWGIWGACDVGAPHKRERVFIMAYADGERRNIFAEDERESCPPLDGTEDKTSFGAGSLHRKQWGAGLSGNISHANGERREANKTSEQCAIKSLEQEGRRNESCRADCISRVFSNADSKGKLQQEREREEIRQRTCDCGWWKVEPDVGRVADGVPDLVDRLRCLGNAVVPQQAYPIFEAIAQFVGGKG